MSAASHHVNPSALSCLFLHKTTRPNWEMILFSILELLSVRLSNLQLKHLEMMLATVGMLSDISCTTFPESSHCNAFKVHNPQASFGITPLHPDADASVVNWISALLYWIAHSFHDLIDALHRWTIGFWYQYVPPRLFSSLR